MTRPSRPESVGLLLLGLTLLTLAATLRAAQPGLLNGGAQRWLALPATCYVATALLVAGPTARAALLFAGAAVIHVAYALVMGSVFAVVTGKGSGLTISVLAEGLTAYPPGIVLQAAFVVPLMAITARVLAAADQEEMGREEQEALARADTAESFLLAVLIIEAMRGEQAGSTLRRMARRAQDILSQRSRETAGDTTAQGVAAEAVQEESRETA